MSTAGILSNLVSSIGGFLLGFVMARIGQRVEEVSEVIVDGKNPAEMPPRRPRFSWRQVLGVIVLLLAVLSTVTAAVATREQRASAEQMRRISECQAEFNRSYRLALTERASAATEERKAMRTMLEAILSPVSGPDAQRAAITQYYASLDQADKTRAENPLPTTDRCQ